MSNGVAYHVTTDGFYFNWDQSSSTLRYQFAWALMAGVSYAVTPHFLIDSAIAISILAPFFLGIAFVLAERGTGLSDAANRSEEIRVGLRYMID